MRLQQAPEKWSPSYQNNLNTELASADRGNRKTGADIELVKERLVIRSPNGSRFALTVANDGTLSAAAL